MSILENIDFLEIMTTVFKYIDGFDQDCINHTNNLTGFIYESVHVKRNTKTPYSVVLSDILRKIITLDVLSSVSIRKQRQTGVLNKH